MLKHLTHFAVHVQAVVAEVDLHPFFQQLPAERLWCT